MDDANNLFTNYYDDYLGVNLNSFNQDVIDNDTFYYDDVETLEGDQPIETTLHIVLAFFITIINLLVICVIISDKSLRTSPKYIQVLNLTFADLIYSVAVLPLLAEFNIRDKWIHFCELKLFAELFDSSFHPAFTWLALSVLNIVILFTVCTTLFDKRSKRPYIAMALMLLPWAMTCLGFIPLYRVIVEPLVLRGHPCMYTISPQRHVALLLLTYPLMCLFLVMTSFLTVVLVLYRRNVSLCGSLCVKTFPSRGDNRVPRGDPEDERREFMFDVLLVSILTVMLSFPVFALQMYFKLKNGDRNCSSDEECDMYILGSRIVHFLHVSRSAVIPVVWFLGKDFRYGFIQLMKCGKTKEIKQDL
ncbi:orexin receptor type 2-like [Haliotis cracherodii]|uniref:orexin receptor type 2-like n=1 Tax=Haliotis cracherodii TaxID=6455 RepID=UPI0039E84125